MNVRVISEQRGRIVEIVCASTGNVVDAMELNTDQARYAIENGDEFGLIVGDAVRSVLMQLLVRQKHTHGDDKSCCVYPPAYTGPAPIVEQINTLATLFDLSLGETMRFVEQALPTINMPDGAEGWFAIPKVEAIAARHFKSVTNPNERYCRAVLLMLEKIKEARRFYNYREGEITADRLRQHARTAAMLERIGEVQRGDILVIPSQFGLRHAGRSVRRGRAVYAKTEFGHGALAVGSMLLTHPKRLVRWKQLHIDCGGDEFAHGAVGQFSFAPFFDFCNGRVGFGAVDVVSANDRYGTASGFSLQ